MPNVTIQSGEEPDLGQYSIAIAKALDKAYFTEQITEEDYNLVKQFMVDIHPFDTTQKKYRVQHNLLFIRNFLKPFRENTIEDLKICVNTLNNGWSNKGQTITTSGILNYIRTLKRFYKWMIDRGFCSFQKQDLDSLPTPIMDASYHKGFHLATEKYYDYSEVALERALTEGRCTEDDADLLREYISEISVNLSAKRVYKYYYIMIGWRRFVGPFRYNKATDLFAGVEKLKRTSGFSKHTIADYVQFIKRFYRWMVENEYSDIPEKKIDKLKIPKPDKMTVTAEELITEDEVLRMIKTAWCSRDRALIAVLWESGCRIGEIGTLQWKQVKFTDWNVLINTDEKTGNPRHIPMVMARPYLAAWKNDYPYEPTGNNHVFLNLDTWEPVQYRGIQEKIKKIAKKAGVTRKIKPHLFRHSRITDLIRKGYNESVIKKMMWGNLTTNMFAVYAHLTDNDIDAEIARKAGITTEEDREKSPLEARQCPRCFTINGPTMNICSQCGLALTQEGLATSEILKKQLEKLTKEQIIELLSKSS